MIKRVYTKVNSAEEFESLKENVDSVQWWHDSLCRYTNCADISDYVTEIFLDTDPTAAVEYPQLVCAELEF